MKLDRNCFKRGVQKVSGLMMKNVLNLALMLLLVLASKCMGGEEVHIRGLVKSCPA